MATLNSQDIKIIEKILNNSLMKILSRERFERIDKNNPFLSSIIRRLYYRRGFNSVKRKVRGKNNKINYKNAILTSAIIQIKGSGNVIEIKEGCVLTNFKITIYGDNHRVLIHNHCRFTCDKIGWNIRIEDNGCSLLIGEKSTFYDVHFILTEPGSQINIGSDCMFATDVELRTGDTHSIISVESNERINYARNISIGRHVWVCAHSRLLKGTTVPDNSVVAIGSVVSRRYKGEGIIVGGNPATQLMAGITWSRERIYKTESK